MHQRLVLAALLAIVAPVPVFAQSTAARDNIDALIEIQAKANKVPAAFIHKVVKRESNYNPNAKGGSALGLMQIKHATARSLGYKGDPAGLFDPETNLKYGIAYLAGAYRAAQGDLDQAYRYYNRGYYYAAKKLGITTDVAEADVPAPAATSATGFASLFGGRPQAAAAPVLTASADPNAAVGGTAALAFAAAGAPVSAVEVPLPPLRPASLGGGATTVAESPAPAQVAAASAALPAQQQGAAAEASSDKVEVPLPPRRPSAVLLAANTRPAVAQKPGASAPVVEAAAIAPAQ